MQPGNWADRGCNMTPPRKRADFQLDQSLRENLCNLQREEKQMNVDSSMCASSGRAAHWEQIDWVRCERQVGRLQARIVKAAREGHWGKVKTLQRLLTHSFSGKALAVKRVTEKIPPCCGREWYLVVRCSVQVHRVVWIMVFRLTLAFDSWNFPTNPLW